MQTTAPISKPMMWTGRIMSAIPVLLILFGSVMKLMRAPSVLEGVGRYGISEQLVVPIGVIELVCAVLYLIPSTSVLGAILITGLMGGATFTTLRIGDPTYVMNIILGMMAWGGLYLRDRRIRELIPLRSSGE